MSILTKEVIQKILNDDWLLMDDCEGLENCTVIKELARMALAAMDSEPVAVIDQSNLDYLRSGADADVWPPEREEMGDVLLYRHAQPAPERKPVKRFNADQMHRICLEANRHFDKYGAMAKEVNKLLGRTPAQPAPVVPDKMNYQDGVLFVLNNDMSSIERGTVAMRAWNACRAAMIAATPQEVPDGK